MKNVIIVPDGVTEVYRRGEIAVSWEPILQAAAVNFRDSNAAAQYIRSHFPDIAIRERVVVVMLDRANNVIGHFLVGLGGSDHCPASVKMIMQVALGTGAAGLVLAHNHPSGQMRPSDEDRNFTKRVNDGAKLFEIKVIDHMIFAPDPGIRPYSFADEGDI